MKVLSSWPCPDCGASGIDPSRGGLCPSCHGAGARPPTEAEAWQRQDARPAVDKAAVAAESARRARDEALKRAVGH